MYLFQNRICLFSIYKKICLHLCDMYIDRNYTLCYNING